MTFLKSIALSMMMFSSLVLAQSSTGDSILVDEYIVEQEFIEATVVAVYPSRNTLRVRGAKRGQTREFTMSPDTRITVNGKQARLRDIRRGDKVLLVMKPEAYEVVISSIRVPESPTSVEERRAEAQPVMLPKTASFWPAVFLVGILALLGAAALRLRRRATESA